MVAVSGSYLLNSIITFAAETGRKLRWSAYFIFVASGLGWLANTAALPSRSCFCRSG
jgi:putative flippase GtrA